ELRVLHAAVDVVVVPRPVGALVGAQPLVGPLGVGAAATDEQGHGRLHVVPRVGVTTGEPRDHAVGELDPGDGVDRGRHLVGLEDATDVRQLHAPAPLVAPVLPQAWWRT